MTLSARCAAQAARAMFLRLCRSKLFSIFNCYISASAALGGLSCFIFIAGCGGGSGGGSSTPPNPSPSVTSVSPASGTAGGPAFTATVSGSNFISSSTVEWNGSARPTTFTSGTSIQAAITAADIATAGTASVAVSNPAPGGGTSSSLTFTINNPVPALTSIAPNALVAGSPAFTLALTGSNFVKTSAVQWNGSPRTTTFVSNTSLQAAISAADIANPGTASVAVSSPTPGGGSSAAVNFIIQTPPPTITLMTPSSAVAGNPAFTVAVTGTRFEASSVINWNGSPRTTTFISATSLQAAVSAEDIAAIGTAKVTVVNPIADGGASTPSAFFVGQAGGSDYAFAVVTQPAQDIVYDQINNLFYLSVASSSSANPNTICVLDPATFTITSLTLLTASSNPNRLAISTDNQFLYAGLDGAGSIQRFALPGLKKDITITLGANAYSPTSVASDIQAAPGSPHTIAVAIGAVIPNTSGGETAPGAAGLVIFDDGTARPTRVPGTLGTGNTFSTIVWGSDATRIFAADTNDESYLFFSISVNASGATLAQNFGSRFETFNPRIHYDNGTNLIYSDGGPAVDPNGVPSGSFVAFGTTDFLNVMTPDSNLGTAFFANQNLSGSGSINVQSYDLTHFSPISTANVPNGSGQPTRVIRWAQNGLALLTNQGQVVLLGGNFVDTPHPPTFTPPPTPAPISVPAPNAPSISSLAPSSTIAGSAQTTLMVNGSAFNSSATVQFNGTSLPTTFVSSSQLTATIAASAIATPGTASITVANPVSSGGVSAPSTFFIGATGGTSQSGSDFAVTVLNQPAKDLKFDPMRNWIYLSVPGSSTTLANTIAVLDPATTTIVGNQYAGAQPNHLSLSDDGQFLYASIDGSSSIQRFVLPNIQTDINFGLGDDPTWGPYYATDVQVAPGAPHTTAVSRGVIPVGEGAAGGVVIYDDATARPTSVPGFGHTQNLLDFLQWGSDATTLYAANAESSGNDFYVVAVTPDGATLTHDYPGVGNFESRIHFNSSTNLIYYDGGNVVDPSSGANLTGFSSGSVMIPDATLNRAFFVGMTGNSAVITSFNLTTRAQIDTITIPSVFGFSAIHLIRWGQNGLAFETDENQLYLVGGSFIH
jgi:hypothetical protein